MRAIPIKIFNLAHTTLDDLQIDEWLDHLGVSGDFTLPEEVTHPAQLIGLAGKRCYMSFEVGLNPNVQKIRTDWAEYLDNVLKSGHGSVMEHATYTFAIEGVSRVFTGEMNRHRAGVAISEGSMRFIRYEDIPFWMPLSIQTTDEDEALYDRVIEDGPSEVDEATMEQFALIDKKKKSQLVFARAFGAAEAFYSDLKDIWSDELSPESKFAAKKQITSMMRRIIPMGVATGGIWTLNIRALRHVLTMRAEPAAEEEICFVASTIAKYICEKEPMLFGDFHQDEFGFWYPNYRKV